MIDQDTGSAIVGPARADIYWGVGHQAGHIAGHLGKFAMLVPRELDLLGHAELFEPVCNLLHRGPLRS